MSISGIIIAKNEEKMIKDCLVSLKFCDELIVIDNESSDKTSEIGKSYGARIIKVNSKDFSRLRNEGLESASSDWVLYVDADERVTPELVSSIKQQVLSARGAGIMAFKIKRRNFYYGNHEWPYIEKTIRLFRKDKLRGWRGKIHESPVIDGEVEELDGFLLHYAHRDLTQMLNKTIEWSEVEADERFKNNHPKMSWWRFPRVMIGAFYVSYIGQKGYKAGTVGIIESIYQAFSVFITYAKLWEKQDKLKYKDEE